jgi:hypothetical protein
MTQGYALGYRMLAFQAMKEDALVESFQLVPTRTST